MQINKRKILKKVIAVVILVIILLLLILGIQSSEFGKIAKYDTQSKSLRETISNFISSSSKTDNGMNVTFTSDNVANLGDFVFNISGDKKLIANISLKNTLNENLSTGKVKEIYFNQFIIQ